LINRSYTILARASAAMLLRRSRVEQVDAPTASDGNERVRFGIFAIELHRLQVQTRERADDLEVAELFGADVHEEIFAFRVLTIQSLNGVLHRRREFTIRAAELLEQHVAKPRVRNVNSHGVHQLLYMVVHAASWLSNQLTCRPVRSRMCAHNGRCSRRICPHSIKHALRRGQYSSDPCTQMKL
jgi:hypothetical protein